MSTEHPIPPITDPKGRHWEQPRREDILVDGEHALMSQATLEQLPNYTGSRPTGVYFGKMWRAQFRGVWWLAWYGPDDDPTKASINWRKVLVT